MQYEEKILKLNQFKKMLLKTGYAKIKILIYSNFVNFVIRKKMFKKIMNLNLSKKIGISI